MKPTPRECAARRSAISAAVPAGVGLGLLLLLLPSARASDATVLAGGAPDDPSGARLLAGASVLLLQAPGSLMVRIARGPSVRGSSPEEIVTAAASCSGEPLAHRCTEQTFANELGRIRRELPSFFIDRTEVRVFDYLRCSALGRCAPPPYDAGAERLKRPDLPVVLVRWRDADAYCRFRGARLPSEEEFERAARGGDGRAYPFGNAFNKRAANHGRLGVMANDDSDGFAELAPVTAFAAGRTPDGILNLAGNAAEWQGDAYRERYSDPEPDGSQPLRRVVRGGSYLMAAPWLRGAARQGIAPDTQRPDLGFRCARSDTERQ